MEASSTLLLMPPLDEAAVGLALTGAASFLAPASHYVAGVSMAFALIHL